MKNHSKIIAALFSGQSLSQIAGSLKLKPATIESLFLNPSFRQALDAAIAALDAELLSLALNQLRSILSHSDPKILLSAIETVLKRDLNLADKRPSGCNESQTVVWKWADAPQSPQSPASPDP